jgi:serine/threonine protein kinase
MSKVFTITEGLENMGAMKTGGQGSVYKGKRKGEIITAIKLLPTPIHSESHEDKNYIAFKNEVEKLKKVNEIPNPNVVKILSSGITDTGNLPFIEMEYIEGPDLEDLLKPPHDPVFTIKEVIKIADQLSHALAHCHKVGVKHGDMKSNNVKYNIHTGNYMLLDFGLAVMSEEQRRTSLRQAGAIEFMAPEQSEGHTLFQTDIYSFGIIMFELLAGTVPFPLRDKGEKARTNVMLAHIETPPPNVLQLRKQAIPAAWNDQKKEDEMQVPEWLVSMIYQCIEKRPENRFYNGEDLHDFIWKNSISSNTSNVPVNERIQQLEQENRRLRNELTQLQQQAASFSGPSSPSPTTAIVSTPAHASQNNSDYYTSRRNKTVSTGTILLVILTLLGLGAGAYFLFNNKKPDAQQTAAVPNQVPANKTVVGQYKVAVPRAYFHDEADEKTRRNAYAIPSEAIIKAYDDKNGFIYTEIANPKGQVSKGWLRKEDLKTLEEANRGVVTGQPQLTNEDIQAQLRTARQLVNSDKVEEALPVYENLLDQHVPEALYEYSNLAFKNQNPNIDCKRAFELMTEASNEGYTLAKRTLGFLYSFADDKYTLEENNYYSRCSFTKNMAKGSKLLMEAMVAGDSTAARYINDLNTINKQQEPPQ